MIQETTQVTISAPPSFNIITEGIQGPPGPSSATSLGGYALDLTNIQQGDHLEFSSSVWTAVRKKSLVDGGNF